MTTEIQIWEEPIKDIPGYEKLYAVTKDGKVWSYPKFKGRSHQGMWLKNNIRHGYFYVNLVKIKKLKKFQVHRLVAITYLPIKSDKNCVNHINLNKQDNRIENLEWCTITENNRHFVKNGERKETEKLYLSRVENIKKSHLLRRKFTPKQIKKIRNLHKNGMNCHRIAKKFELDSNAPIYQIVKFISYREI